MTISLKGLFHRHTTRKQPTLDDIIPKEIDNDAFYRAIVRYASTESISSILEIGSSAGEGRTRAFVDGIIQNPAKPQLYCMEVSQVRFEALKNTYAKQPFVHPFNYSSVPLQSFAAPEDVRHFYGTYSTNLNQFPLDKVLG